MASRKLTISCAGVHLSTVISRLIEEACPLTMTSGTQDQESSSRAVDCPAGSSSLLSLWLQSDYN